MGDTEQQPPEPDEYPEYADDPVGRELAVAIRANEAMLSGLRYDAGQKMLRAQAGDGEMPSPFDLLAIKRLEQQIQNDKAHARTRTLTRKRAAV